MFIAKLRDGGMMGLPPETIISYEAFKGYVRLVCVVGSSHLVLNTLAECEEALAALEGIEIERGRVINPQYCVVWEEKGRNAIALMQSGERLNVSRRMKARFVELMKRLLGER